MQDDIQDIEEDQVIPCKPIGDWVFESELGLEDDIFELENSADIQTLVL